MSNGCAVRVIAGVLGLPKPLHAAWVQRMNLRSLLCLTLGGWLAVASAGAAIELKHVLQRDKS